VHAEERGEVDRERDVFLGRADQAPPEGEEFLFRAHSPSFSCAMHARLASAHRMGAIALE
jgi:hypothetical protein